MHEREDINARAVAVGALAVLAAIAVAALIAGLAWRTWLPAGSATGPDTSPNLSIQGVALSSAPQSERAQYFAQKNSLISSYQWLDPEQGLARIPVDEAMRILAERKRQQTDKDPR